MTTGGHTEETTTQIADPVLDESLVEEFAERLFGFYTGGMLTYLVDIGHRTGLFDAATGGPATSAELADRAGLYERYVREWLGAMVTGGVMDYDAEARTYHLPAERAACLTGGGTNNLAPFALLNTHLAKHVGGVTGAFREGGGVPYHEYRPEFTDVMDGLNRGGFDEALVSEWLELVPGVRERLAGGARVADVGCGTGHALVVMATAFPQSTFVGYDTAEDAIMRARREASEADVANARFEVGDAATLAVDEPFDIAFVFDAIHDQVAPAQVLQRIHDMLTRDGLLLAFEPHASSNLEDNVAHPLAPFLYSISTLHCLTVSLAHDGAGLGTVWGEQKARQMLLEAGFSEVSVREVPNEPVNALYVARR
ncbi:MAG: class I SAM-dependent methyltransferase [Actinomycetota bacterium]|nr:class I SAM-dependent methyltransferase [Actinomycetota bacterium]